MLIAFWIFTILMVGFIFYMLKTTKADKEYEQKLKRSLEDEFIIDPETGIKITLEEAETGHWVSHDNEFRPIPESDIESQILDDHKTLARALNYLITRKEYLKSSLTEEQIDLLNKLKSLAKYDGWTYSDAFSFDKGMVIFLAPEIYGKTYWEDDYIETQLMFWIKIENTEGHYYLREKTQTEKLLDKFRNDDCLQLDDYESFTFKKSYKLLKIQKLVENFANQKGLEIEFYKDNLIIKNRKLANTEDIIRIEEIIKNICY